MDAKIDHERRLSKLEATVIQIEKQFDEMRQDVRSLAGEVREMRLTLQEVRHGAPWWSIPITAIASVILGGNGSEILARMLGP